MSRERCNVVGTVEHCTAPKYVSTVANPQIFLSLKFLVCAPCARTVAILYIFFEKFLFYFPGSVILHLYLHCCSHSVQYCTKNHGWKRRKHVQPRVGA